MTLVKDRLGLDVELTPGGTGQFDVIADGRTVATRGGNFLTRKFGMGYPGLEAVVDLLDRQAAGR